MPSSGGCGPGDTGAPGYAMFPWPHHGTFLAPNKNGPHLHNVSKGLMFFISLGMSPTVPLVRFPRGPHWLQLPNLAVQRSWRAGWHNGGAKRWWHHSNLLWATPLESTPPHSQSQFIPRKIPWLINFSGATVTSCGLILSVLYMEMFVPVFSETISLNSSGIHGHLLSTSLDLTAK